MGKTTAQWRDIYKARNERRRVADKAERLFNRTMGRALSARQWDKSNNSLKES